MKMSKKSLKIVLILVTILSLISTFSLATDTSSDAANTPVTTSEDTATTNETVEGTEGETSTDGTTTTEDSALTTDDTSTSTEASTNNDIYLIEEEVIISESETVNGNVFVIADTLTIKGQIGGDLFVIANTLNIDGGQIYGNVFAIAGDITLNGLIYDLYANCNTLNMPYDGVAYRDLKVNCTSATIEGVVGKDVNINATNKLYLKAEALIYGNVNLTSPNDIELIAVDQDGNAVEGKTIDLIVTGDVNHEKNANSVLDYVVSLLTALVYTLVVWLLLSKVTPKFYGKVTEMKPKKMLLAIVAGLVSLIVIPLVAMLLIVTVVGVPVAFALLAIYSLVISIASALTAIVLANKLATKVKALAKFNNIFAVVIVALVLWALTLIPYAGGIITLLVTFFGFGMVILAFKKKKEKKAETPVEKAE